MTKGEIRFASFCQRIREIDSRLEIIKIPFLFKEAPTVSIRLGKMEVKMLYPSLIEQYNKCPVETMEKLSESIKRIIKERVDS